MLLLVVLAGCVKMEVQESTSAPGETMPSTESDSVTTPPAGKMYELELTMKGSEALVLEFGQEFRDSGAEAWGWDAASGSEKISVEVQITGTVDSQTLGCYTLTYSASYQGIEKSLQRTVTVVDTTAPVITLVPDPEGSYLLPGEVYQEAGFSATDACDGDLTDWVVVRSDGDRMVYQVADSSGNQTTVYRQLIVDDPIPPVLELDGELEIEIFVGGFWQEPGFSAADNVDGDLTGMVQVSGTVDPNTAGEYVLTYEVVDGFGNVATAQRRVCVKAATPPVVVEPNGKVIYLTFDDGPSEYTERLLKILAKYDVKATFFVINTDYMHLIDDIVAGGHSIALHTKSHRYQKIYASEEAFFEDLYALQDIVYDRSGVMTTLMRFPGGSSNRVSKKYCVGIMSRLIKSVQDRGFVFFDWNVDSDDAGSANTADAVFQNVKDGVKGKQYSVVLQHDTRKYSVEAVEKIILWGLENGYTFLPLDSSSPTCHHSWVAN